MYLPNNSATRPWLTVEPRARARSNWQHANLAAGVWHTACAGAASTEAAAAADDDDDADADAGADAGAGEESSFLSPFAVPPTALLPPEVTVIKKS